MLLFRFLLFGLLGASAVCFAFYIGTGEARYRLWGLKVLRWTVVAALAFFAVMMLGRMV